MKKLLLIVVLALLTSPSFAQATKDITLAWDNADDYQTFDIQSVQLFNIYDSANPVIVTSVACTSTDGVPTCPTQVTFSITMGTKYVFVAAYYDGIQTGDYSNTVATPPGAKPKNLHK